MGRCLTMNHNFIETANFDDNKKFMDEISFG